MNNASCLTASGDNTESVSPSLEDTEKPIINLGIRDLVDEQQKSISDDTSKSLNEIDLKLKQRIDQCKNIIESLKNELKDEKNKFAKEASKEDLEGVIGDGYDRYKDNPTDYVHELNPVDSGLYNDSVEMKLHCDDSLLEYEKQLQKYQNTLNLAQMEKKNAIRKQMLAKAFKLKLMEVENQCNIELLRVKQSLQCLEPLQLIANKWKTNSNQPEYDLSNYDLIPRFLELSCSPEADESHKKDESVSNLPTKSLEVPDSVSE